VPQAFRGWSPEESQQWHPESVSARRLCGRPHVQQVLVIDMILAEAVAVG
jgi:hypothetical protein